MTTYKGKITELVEPKMRLLFCWLMIFCCVLLVQNISFADESSSISPVEKLFDCDAVNKALGLLKEETEDPHEISVAATEFLMGRCGKADPEKGLELLHYLSRTQYAAPSPQIPLFLGLAYLKGWGTEPDLEESQYWFRHYAIIEALLGKGEAKVFFDALSILHGLTELPELLLAEIDTAEKIHDSPPSEYMRIYRALWVGDNGYPLDQQAAVRYLSMAITFSITAKKHPEALFEMGTKILNRQINSGLSPRREAEAFANGLISRANDFGYAPAHKMFGLECFEQSQQTGDESKRMHAYILLRRAFEGGIKDVEPLMQEIYQGLNKRDRWIVESYQKENTPAYRCHNP